MILKLTEALNVLKKYGCKTKQTALALCRAGELPAVMEQGRWYMDNSYIEAAVKWREEHISLEELEAVSVAFEELDEEGKKHCDRNIRRRLEALGGEVEPDKEGLLFTGTLFSSALASEIRMIIENCVWEDRMRKNLIPASVAAKKLEMSVYQLKQSVRAGTIAGVRVDDDLYIEPDVIEDYLRDKGTLVGVYDWLKEELPVMGVRTVWDIDNRVDRSMLNNMLRQSSVGPLLVSWEQAGLRGDRCNAYYFPLMIQDQVRKIVVDYLKEFGLKEELYELRRQDPYWKDHQKTQEALDIFERTKTIQKMASLYEVFVEVKPPEIMDCTDADIDRLVDYAASKTVFHQQYLAMFLGFAQKNYNCRFTKRVFVDYQNRNSETTVNTSPYSLEQYMLMAYMAFNDDYIKTEGLIEKAMEYAQDAYCWLFTIWHYVAAWRKSDIRRIPVISLPWSGEDVKAHIRSGDWHRYAVETSVLLEHTINSACIKAIKTEKKSTDRYLSVVFPESMRNIIGLSYLIILSHSNEEAIYSCTLTNQNFVDFFGDTYTKVFGNTAYGNRRANKSFLDYISEIVEKDSDNENRVMGYMVASYARAHSINEEGLSAVTAKYLGIKMEGMTKDQIMMALFESGTCSFVPYMLLSVMSREGKFENLRVEDQSRIIKESGMNAYHAEMVSRALVHSYAESKKSVEQVLGMYSEENKTAVAEKILKAIVARHAVTVHEATQCLLHAAGKPCPYGKCTFGCRYALYEHGAMIYAVEFIHERYEALAQARTDGEKKKIRGLLEDVYIPAMIMMLTLCHEKLHVDITAYQETLSNLISGGGNHALHIKEEERPACKNPFDHS